MSYLASRQFHGRFLICCQNTWIDFNELFTKVELFTRCLQKLVKFCQLRKKWEVNYALNYKSKKIPSVLKTLFRFMFSKKNSGSWLGRSLQGYLRLPVFRKCLKWVFQVHFRRFLVGRDSLQVFPLIIEVKSLWITATAGRFYEWVSVFLGKHPREVSRGTLSMVMTPKWSLNRFLCLHSLKR